MTLTARAVEAAKPAQSAYKLADSLGLYLFVAPSGLKSWRANYTEQGKQRTRTYGRWPDTSLADARKLNLIARNAVDSVPLRTIAATVAEFVASTTPALSNPKHRAQVATTLQTFLVDRLGKVELKDIKRAQLVEVCKAVEARGTVETAHRVAGRIGQVFNYAVDAGYLESSPAVGLNRVLQPKRVKRPMASIAPQDAGQLMRDIAAYGDFAGDVVTKTALQVMAHTFVRTGELRGMRWDEMPEPGIWVIPAERMKLRKPHVVPLTQTAQRLIHSLKDRGTNHVFASIRQPDSPISENTMLFALYRMGYRGKMTGHGFRALASTVLNEQSGFPPDVIERQLAHGETNAVRAAYNRAQYLDQRRLLMQWWSAWLLRAEQGTQPQTETPAGANPRNA
jgi:integrase